MAKKQDKVKRYLEFPGSDVYLEIVKVTAIHTDIDYLFHIDRIEGNKVRLTYNAVLFPSIENIQGIKIIREDEDRPAKYQIAIVKASITTVDQSELLVRLLREDPEIDNYFKDHPDSVYSFTKNIPRHHPKFVSAVKSMQICYGVDKCEWEVVDWDKPSYFISNADGYWNERVSFRPEDFRSHPASDAKIYNSYRNPDGSLKGSSNEDRTA